ncbi:hypothetical protein [Fluviispira sanaruensis]|uniref:Cytochrome c domain-containing protein n=1 Tax=Fluviispira sanaruensis TaxID=2493639 RepID=A0A4V0P2M6_FLUSA|nr:hypothetical protein [Fluviispira sanaruensis]BBH53757.1 hypothetical protein JCM31447_22050 [Fluviispira sanaruensis]
MFRKNVRILLPVLLSNFYCSFSHAEDEVKPFENNNGYEPSKQEYNGPKFKLSFNYPNSSKPAENTPWRTSIKNERITVNNAEIYTEALKDAVSKDMRVLIQNYPEWNADDRGWYNEPWLGRAYKNNLKPKEENPNPKLRESIHGMYVGSDLLNKNLFKGTGLKKSFTTYVLTYYDETAAQTLYKVWGRDAQNANIDKAASQFLEGSLIVKAAFTTAGPEIWTAMKGTQAWPLYISVDATKNGKADAVLPPKVTQAYFMQFDIIVKDSKSSPKTGWVFTTLVYDANAPGKDVWDKMVPLGAQWGNDPDINSANNSKAKLLENWINPKAPKYAKMTLGWGGRLSGPNDGAVNDIVYQDRNGKNVYAKNAQNSGCMSCHSSAQWDAKSTMGMNSFLLPATEMPAKSDKNFLVSPAPGSMAWMKWFQSNPGYVPMDAGSVAFDYDMVFTFKSFPLWLSAKTQKKHLLLGVGRSGKSLINMNYNGK